VKAQRLIFCTPAAGVSAAGVSAAGVAASVAGVAASDVAASDVAAGVCVQPASIVADIAIAATRAIDFLRFFIVDYILLKVITTIFAVIVAQGDFLPPLRIPLIIINLHN
jgi:hypothetical protein